MIKVKNFTKSLADFLESNNSEARLERAFFMVDTYSVNRDLLKKTTPHVCGLCGHRIKERDLTVDHIIPLCAVDDSGKRIACGLHVPWNLQVITAKKNRQKMNKIK